VIIIEFLSWHYLKFSKSILKAWFNFIAFAFHLFSVNLLLRTLFAPWRRIESTSQAPGFSLGKFFNRFIFNLISRLIGFLIRTLLISWGLLLALFFFLLGLVGFLLWQFLSPLSWPLFLLNRLKPKEEPLKGKARKFVCRRLGLKDETELKQMPPEEVKGVFEWYLKNKAALERKRRFWQKENLFRFPSLGSDLAFGYTLELDKYCQDLSFPPAFSHQLIGREKEIQAIEAVLARSHQANLLLVGEPGVGKQTILLGLAKAIKEKRVNPGLFFKRVLLLNMSLVLGKSSLLTQGKAKFDQLLKEAQSAGNVILVINQIEKYMSEEEGIDLTPVLSQAAESRGIQLIGVTTPEAFSKFVFPNEQFLKYFEKIEVAAPNRAEALDILEKILPDFERGKKVITTFQALKEIVEQSDKLISHIPFPEKAIDLLDQLINEASSSGKRMITKADVDRLISQKVKVPVGNLEEKEIDKLKNLEPIIHQRLIDQDLAVSRLTKAMQRARVGLAEREKPMGTFLFLGPTGVGKTETAKALAQAYFGDEKRMVRFDMSQPFSLALFIKESREHPYAVLLLDEFEKAKTETVHLFLTVFDEGYCKDKEGKMVSFKNMIIICTSNAGAEFIRQKLETGLKAQEVIEHVLQKGIFSPELINRFDGVIIYQPLTPAHLEEIAKLKLAQLKEGLNKKGLVLEIERGVCKEIGSQGYSPEFGARPMKRLIADKIESLIAEKMLDKKINQGDTIKLSVKPASKEFIIQKG
jgi:ATP-dependent Clp protease ATP-binding subunit ClpA